MGTNCPDQHLTRLHEACSCSEHDNSRPFSFAGHPVFCFLPFHVKQLKSVQQFTLRDFTSYRTTTGATDTEPEEAENETSQHDHPGGYTDCPY
jgi:hypothetical protein